MEQIRTFFEGSYWVIEGDNRYAEYSTPASAWRNCKKIASALGAVALLFDKRGKLIRKENLVDGRPTEKLTERYIHEQVVFWLREKWPDVIFWSDLSGIRLPYHVALQAARLKAKRGIPDLFIAEPRGGYYGMFVEIKRNKEEVFKKDGGVRRTAHLIEQAEMLNDLRERGYKAVFCYGLKNTRETIQNYLQNGI